jgi:hypothetical protein
LKAAQRTTATAPSNDEKKLFCFSFFYYLSFEVGQELQRQNVDHRKH